jgi:hypothetical protein
LENDDGDDKDPSAPPNQIEHFPLLKNHDCNEKVFVKDIHGII